MSIMNEDQAALLPLADYAARAGKSLRTVQRWVAAGELPDASQDDEGRWWVPASARRRRTSSRDVVAASEATSSYDVVPVSPSSGASALGMLGTLEDAAAALGTTVGGVRRMGRDGLLHVGRYGPHGALRVYLPPSGSDGVVRRRTSA